MPTPKADDYYPDEIKDFFGYIEKYTKQVFTPKWEEIKESELKQVKGLLQVDDKKEEIDESLKPIVQVEDEGIQKIIVKLKDLRDSGELPKVEHEQDDKK
jgi:disulfide oxidoreductase YuzD